MKSAGIKPTKGKIKFIDKFGRRQINPAGLKGAKAVLY